MARRQTLASINRDNWRRGEVGGTHPALIESMGRGALTLYLDTPENREVAGDAAIAFTHGDLAAKLREVLAMSEEARDELRRRAAARIAERYSWGAVTSAYERLLGDLVADARLHNR